MLIIPILVLLPLVWLTFENRPSRGRRSDRRFWKSEQWPELLSLLTALAAIGADWFWALNPLFKPLFYLYPADWTDADLIRHIWRFRLVEPQWVSTPPDLWRWSLTETLARLIVVNVIWLTTRIILKRYFVLRRLRVEASLVSKNPPA
jgi:hypothetical protein